MNKKNRVKLTPAQREELETMTSRGTIKVRTYKRAQVLLLSDEANPAGGKSDVEIAERVKFTVPTVERVRRRFVESGLAGALYEKPRSGAPKRFTGKQRAAVTALACSEPPEGRARWTLRLLADTVVELDWDADISHATVDRILKANDRLPHLKRQWCLGKLTTLFLWRMETILDLYERPYDPTRPLICVDERPCQLIDDVLVPLPLEPGKPKREGYEYKRNGVCTVFIAFEPATGRRFIQVRDRRTKADYAAFMHTVAGHYPEAAKIVIIQDNLNTHNPGSFYQAFEPQQAFELGQSFEMHYTPKGASWLNMVEIELSALSKQCLDRRIADQETLEREVLAWAKERDAKQATVDWQFTISKARDKFKKFYPNPSKLV